MVLLVTKPAKGDVIESFALRSAKAPRVACAADDLARRAFGAFRQWQRNRHRVGGGPALPGRTIGAHLVAIGHAGEHGVILPARHLHGVDDLRLSE